MISIALSKGRILEETLPLLARVGLRPKEDPERSRKLIVADRAPRRAAGRGARFRRAHLRRQWRRGASASPAATCSLEHGGAGLYQPIDLGIARCRIDGGGAPRLRLRGRGAAGRAAAHRHQVREPDARALRGQGRARGPDQAVRLDGARAAAGPCRRHRRPGFERQDAAREQPGRGGGDSCRSRRAWSSTRRR